ncbi:MAG: D-Lactate dehydrogenase, cytochrome c-dependent [uncultured Sphingomonadaceae bacterium]|uniref:D-lactate dehydrogenase (cytochrome) n=1 Tax=uncultured Sphingomonadaceae bacterium TaxID=169976 RepID=A0A6J4TSN2_9SPHN|nr:MAG: D-Lactate dehydrogenase, cytochrome c-dependent [uncultured Sphingomonadaceae bacterium]
MQQAQPADTLRERARALADELAPAFGPRLLTSPAALDQYGASEGHHGPHLPHLVARPESIDEVRLLVRSAGARRIPVVPYGAGTSLEGNAAAVAGGLCLDLSAMTRIIEVSAEDLLCVVEPGVTREQLNADLRNTGLFFPVDPGANATLGGMIATRASGTNAVRYGTMRENLLALKVVLADGTLIRTGSRARKSSAGYDLTHLLAGSEGTLGIIVEATLRLHGVPEAVLAGTWRFETLDGAVQTVIATIQSAVPVARMELLDGAAIRACNRYAHLDLPEGPTLFLELHGSPAGVQEQLETVEAIGSELGGGELAKALEPEARARLWKARHHALPAARALVPGAATWVTDVCVPISHLAEAITRTQRAIEQEDLLAPILGHVGDGNFHVFFVLPPGDERARAAADRVNGAMVEHALSVGGTCTGEHGIGIGKREALVREHGVEAVLLMRRLKETMDPDGILNPMKLFGDSLLPPRYTGA